ncbi:ABC transporter ATP-binding protein [Lichenifustis flavocetrariae]|uniref:ABC transporter ATP-binding protein n=1 Tax=Lichenifustis flavocetrariae TaxID=2949735 RepID=A0AA41YZP7_9HYPH|nr:ABC transporter ATP-binding protein [Lichenifustis flavocetrariae]MCW6510271.1 ABC transporter ATP-binding protein [Lichenifustis flavocetrariae]
MTTRAVGLKAEGIGKAFGSFRALDNISLDIAPGEFLTLLGPSGSGKTTFLMILAGFEKPTVGRLTSEETDITTRSAEARSFGMVFQGYALFPHMSVEQNVAFPLQVRGVPREEIAKRVDAMIARVGLVGHEKKRPAKLSGGQQQRVALARALIFEPPVLLLDEPFSALDKHLRGRMQDEVKRLHGEFGTTFVFVTHDQSEALSLSSRVAIFNHGELLQIATPQAIYERPESRFVAEFLGEINLLPIERVGHCAAGTSGLFEGHAIKAPSQDHAAATGTLAIRPEHMSVCATRRGDHNGVAACVTGTTYLGAAMRLALATSGGTRLSVTLPMEAAAAALSKGPDLWVTWPADKGFLLPEPH